jgi:hypothetical protein
MSGVVVNVSLKVDVLSGGPEAAARTLQALSSAFARRGPMHAAMATTVVQFTQDFLIRTPRHKTATRLGATPTGFRERSAKFLQPEWDDAAAVMRIPRSTGLGRAFGDVLITPGTGRKYLTIPDSAETYGKVVRDFPEGAFDFAILQAHRPFPVLVWTEDGGAHRKGDVAYWLRTSVLQRQDRSLLPSDEGLREVGRRAAVAYVANQVYNA